LGLILVAKSFEGPSDFGGKIFWGAKWYWWHNLLRGQVILASKQTQLRHLWPLGGPTFWYSGDRVQTNHKWVLCLSPRRKSVCYLSC
jgi:hypothetical protein